jgi:hypothetical protein
MSSEIAAGRGGRIFWRVLALLGMTVMPSTAWSYKVNCGAGGPYVPDVISSVFGEARKDGCNPGTA